MVVDIMKLNKELAYLIGFWKVRSTRDGIGIVGEEEVQQKFVAELLKNKLTTPERILLKENIVMFHHIKIRNELLEVVKNQNDIFARKNKLTAAYIKGMYDSQGSFENGILLINNTTFQDQMLIERLGFYTQRKKGILRIKSPEKFFMFIKKYE